MLPSCESEKFIHLPVGADTNECIDSGRHLLYFFIYGKQRRTISTAGGA
jgi:hypothetical protein